MTRPRLDIIEHLSEHGSWTLIRRAPALALRRHIQAYGGYIEHGGQPVWRREIASPIVPLIFNFDRPWDIAELGRVGEARTFERSFVAGLHDRPVLVGSRGRALCLQVDLTPLGAALLLGAPMDELAGRTIAVRDAIGPIADRLDDELFHAPDWAARFDLLDRVFLERLAAARPPSPLVATALGAIESSSGNIAIGALARQLEVSRKHLDAMFRRALGLPPKRLARLVRFSRALTVLSSGGAGSLAELAHACGYYDQAHLNRDFRAFAGEAPLAFLKRCLPDGTGAIER